jgi:hypothetical protein
MKILTFLIALLSTSSCATSPGFDALSLCGSGDPHQWQLTHAIPRDAATLRALADANPNHPVGRVDYPIEQWFLASNSQIMLCRSDRRSCSGEWWVFEEDNGGPVISRQDAWICVTGAGPNNSFKPKPLRGSA